MPLNNESRGPPSGHVVPAIAWTTPQLAPFLCTDAPLTITLRPAVPAPRGLPVLSAARVPAVPAADALPARYQPVLAPLMFPRVNLPFVTPFKPTIDLYFPVAFFRLTSFVTFNTTGPRYLPDESTAWTDAFFTPLAGTPAIEKDPPDARAANVRPVDATNNTFDTDVSANLPDTVMPPAASIGVPYTETPAATTVATATRFLRRPMVALP